MTKAILFSQRRWNSKGEEALDTIEEYVELINEKSAALWPLWKIQKKSSTNEPFKHKEIKTGYIYSSMYRKNIDAVETKYMGKVGHKINIEWIKDGGELRVSGLSVITQRVVVDPNAICPGITMFFGGGLSWTNFSCKIGEAFYKTGNLTLLFSRN